eukprot:GEMP01031290.1.p1 GENE.GEMP01031290.1~~GEMP01031290.1.p1  ORF type:complete len:315 (+),score=74.11 GEMP01031290.1:132-1076(+)
MMDPRSIFFSASVIFALSTLVCGDDEADFLKWHNVYRCTVGSPPLHIDKKLADYARNHANTGTKSHSNSRRDINAGENMAWGQGIKQTINSWFSEFPSGLHYTAMVWKNGDTLGCFKTSGGGGGGGGGMFGFGGGGGGGTIFCNYGSTKGDVPNGGNRRSNVPNEKVKSLDECEAEIESGGTTTTEQTPAPPPATTPAASPPPSDSTASPDSTETEPADSTDTASDSSDTASDSSDTASPAPGSTPADAKDKKNDDGNKQTYIIVGCIAGAVLLFMVFRGNNNSNDPEKDAKASGNNKGKGKGTTQAKKMRQQE